MAGPKGPKKAQSTDKPAEGSKPQDAELLAKLRSILKAYKAGQWTKVHKPLDELYHEQPCPPAVVYCKAKVAFGDFTSSKNDGTCAEREGKLLNIIQILEPYVNCDQPRSWLVFCFFVQLHIELARNKAGWEETYKQFDESIKICQVLYKKHNNWTDPLYELLDPKAGAKWEALEAATPEERQKKGLSAYKKLMEDVKREHKESKERVFHREERMFERPDLLLRVLPSALASDAERQSKVQQLAALTMAEDKSKLKAKPNPEGETTERQKQRKQNRRQKDDQKRQQQELTVKKVKEYLSKKLPNSSAEERREAFLKLTEMTVDEFDRHIKELGILKPAELKDWGVMFKDFREQQRWLRWFDPVSERRFQTLEQLLDHVQNHYLQVSSRTLAESRDLLANLHETLPSLRQVWQGDLIEPSHELTGIATPPVAESPENGPWPQRRPSSDGSPADLAALDRYVPLSSSPERSFRSEMDLEAGVDDIELMLNGGSMDSLGLELMAPSRAFGSPRPLNSIMGEQLERFREDAAALRNRMEDNILREHEHIDILEHYRQVSLKIEQEFSGDFPSQEDNMLLNSEELTRHESQLVHHIMNRQLEARKLMDMLKGYAVLQLALGKPAPSYNSCGDASHEGMCDHMSDENTLHSFWENPAQATLRRDILGHLDLPKQGPSPPESPSPSSPLAEASAEVAAEVQAGEAQAEAPADPAAPGEAAAAAGPAADEQVAPEVEEDEVDLRPHYGNGTVVMQKVVDERVGKRVEEPVDKRSDERQSEEYASLEEEHRRRLVEENGCMVAVLRDSGLLTPGLLNTLKTFLWLSGLEEPADSRIPIRDVPLSLMEKLNPEQLQRIRQFLLCMLGSRQGGLVPYMKALERNYEHILQEAHGVIEMVGQEGNMVRLSNLAYSFACRAKTIRTQQQAQMLREHQAAQAAALQQMEAAAAEDAVATAVSALRGEASFDSFKSAHSGDEASPLLGGDAGSGDDQRSTSRHERSSSSDGQRSSARHERSSTDGQRGASHRERSSGDDGQRGSGARHEQGPQQPPPAERGSSDGHRGSARHERGGGDDGQRGSARHERGEEPQPQPQQGPQQAEPAEPPLPEILPGTVQGEDALIDVLYGMDEQEGDHQPPEPLINWDELTYNLLRSSVMVAQRRQLEHQLDAAMLKLARAQSVLQQCPSVQEMKMGESVNECKRDLADEVSRLKAEVLRADVQVYKLQFVAAKESADSHQDRRMEYQKELSELDDREKQEGKRGKGLLPPGMQEKRHQDKLELTQLLKQEDEDMKRAWNLARALEQKLQEAQGLLNAHISPRHQQEHHQLSHILRQMNSGDLLWSPIIRPDKGNWYNRDLRDVVEEMKEMVVNTLRKLFELDIIAEVYKMSSHQLLYSYLQSNLVDPGVIQIVCQAVMRHKLETHAKEDQAKELLEEEERSAKPAADPSKPGTSAASKKKKKKKGGAAKQGAKAGEEGGSDEEAGETAAGVADTTPPPDVSPAVADPQLDQIKAQREQHDQIYNLELERRRLELEKSKMVHPQPRHQEHTIIVSKAALAQHSRSLTTEDEHSIENQRRLAREMGYDNENWEGRSWSEPTFKSGQGKQGQGQGQGSGKQLPYATAVDLSTLGGEAGQATRQGSGSGSGRTDGGGAGCKQPARGPGGAGDRPPKAVRGEPLDSVSEEGSAAALRMLPGASSSGMEDAGRLRRKSRTDEPGAAAEGDRGPRPHGERRGPSRDGGEGTEVASREGSMRGEDGRGGRGGGGPGGRGGQGGQADPHRGNEGRGEGRGGGRGMPRDGRDAGRGRGAEGSSEGSWRRQPGNNGPDAEGSWRHEKETGGGSGRRDRNGRRGEREAHRLDRTGSEGSHGSHTEGNAPVDRQHSSSSGTGHDHAPGAGYGWPSSSAAPIPITPGYLQGDRHDAAMSLSPMDHMAHLGTVGSPPPGAAAGMPDPAHMPGGFPPSSSAHSTPYATMHNVPASAFTEQGFPQSPLHMGGGVPLTFGQHPPNMPASTAQHAQQQQPGPGQPHIGFPFHPPMPPLHPSLTPRGPPGMPFLSDAFPLHHLASPHPPGMPGMPHPSMMHHAVGHPVPQPSAILQPQQDSDEDQDTDLASMLTLLTGSQAQPVAAPLVQSPYPPHHLPHHITPHPMFHDVAAMAPPPAAEQQALRQPSGGHAQHPAQHAQQAQHEAVVATGVPSPAKPGASWAQMLKSRPTPGQPQAHGPPPHAAPPTPHVNGIVLSPMAEHVIEDVEGQDADLRRAMEASLAESRLSATTGYEDDEASSHMLVEDVDQDQARLSSSGAEAHSVGAARGPGLRNATGEYNCFLNVIIQCLWHCRSFRTQALRVAPHTVASQPVVAALLALFRNLSVAEEEWMAGQGSSVVVDPTVLREALDAHMAGKMYRVGEMNDAAELLCTLYECMKEVHALEGVDGAPSLVDEIFGLVLHEYVHCTNCKKMTHQVASHIEYFHVVSATALRTVAEYEPGKSFGVLLRILEAQHTKSCDMDVGGCGNGTAITKKLERTPQVFTVQLAWEENVKPSDIRETMTAVGSEHVDLARVFGATDPPRQSEYRLISMACYYGQHYFAFVLGDDRSWLLFDDYNSSVVGSWANVVHKCVQGRIQPSVLFFSLM